MVSQTGYQRVSLIKMKRVKCKIFSRVVGYMRPTDCWNDGKKSEFDQRKCFQLNQIGG